MTGKQMLYGYTRGKTDQPVTLHDLELEFDANRTVLIFVNSAVWEADWSLINLCIREMYNWYKPGVMVGFVQANGSH